MFTHRKRWLKFDDGNQGCVRTFYDLKIVKKRRRNLFYFY